MPAGMGKRALLIVGIFICLLAASSCRDLKVNHKHHLHNQLASYNHTLARILVQYASAVYLSDLTELFTWTCSRCDGLIEGFDIIELIVDVKHCLQAFVGVAADLNATVVAFRGTQESSLQNWVEDLFWKQLDSSYPGVDDAKVHHGFYSAYHNTSLRPGVINAIKKVKALYGDINVFITGHSMGGAMASFCGLDLCLSLGEQNVQVVTFGQPRIGNSVFSSYYSQVVPNTIRVTNGHDIVPHLPPYYHHFPQKTYHHFPREVWLYNYDGSMVERVCDGSGEDPTCSRSVGGRSISDHLTYYGVHLGCDSPSSCKIVTDPRLVAYGRTDPDGNLVFSRDPSTSILELNTEHGYQESIELYNRKDKIQIPTSSMVTPSRLFSTEAAGSGNDLAGVETVKGIYEKMLNSVVEKRTAPPNALLWSLIAKCSDTEDIKLLFDILQKLRTFRLSNLRIPDGFNSALCREVTKACVRAGAISFGKKALWKHNLFGLTPDIGSAHHLLSHAKQHNDVKLMVEVMQLVKKNDLPLQPGTADIVFSICCNVDRWDLITKYGKRFAKSGVSLRQTSFELWMEFAAKKGDVESLWKIERLRSQAMKQHSVSTGFSCAKGFLLEHKPETAAAIIQVLYQKLVSEWPLDVIKHQKEENKKEAFAAALQTDISGLISALPSLGVRENITMAQFS
ncbi:alpha/beta-Hydrolases superfamily protein [Perilla frutescens var. frutescens]|nr:alpha/beta-Hydrolases superfamily protein [Perilla frutescens var. frutescens]